MSESIDIDQEMLKVMDLKTRCEDENTWQTISIVRRGLRFDKKLFDWHPTQNIEQAFDVIEQFKRPGDYNEIEFSWDYNNHSWRATIQGEEAYASTLPMAICCTVLKLLDKYGDQVLGAEQEE